MLGPVLVYPKTIGVKDISIFYTKCENHLYSWFLVINMVCMIVLLSGFNFSRLRILSVFNIQVVDALDLAQATMTKVHQNLSWAVAYNVVAVPIAAGVLLPHFDFAMTPSLSGELHIIVAIISNIVIFNWDSVI